MSKILQDTSWALQLDRPSKERAKKSKECNRSVAETISQRTVEIPPGTATRAVDQMYYNQCNAVWTWTANLKIERGDDACYWSSLFYVKAKEYAIQTCNTQHLLGLYREDNNANWGIRNLVLLNSPYILCQYTSILLDIPEKDDVPIRISDFTEAHYRILAQKSWLDRLEAWQTWQIPRPY